MTLLAGGRSFLIPALCIGYSLIKHDRMPSDEHFVLNKRAPVEPDIIERLRAIGTRRKVSNNALISQRGDDAKGFWFVETGQIKAMRLDTDGNVMLFDIIEEGHIFGELAYFHKVKRQVDAIAMGDVSLIWLSDAVVQNLLMTEPAIAIRLIESLAGQLYLALNRLAAARHNSPLGKAAQFLYDSAMAHGAMLRLTQQDLADAIDVSRNTASTLLSQLIEAGVIEKGYGWLRILDADGLKQFAR